MVKLGVGTTIGYSLLVVTAIKRNLSVNNCHGDTVIIATWYKLQCNTVE